MQALEMEVDEDRQPLTGSKKRGGKQGPRIIRLQTTTASSSSSSRGATIWKVTALTFVVLLAYTVLFPSSNQEASTDVPTDASTTASRTVEIPATDASTDSTEEENRAFTSTASAASAASSASTASTATSTTSSASTSTTPSTSTSTAATESSRNTNSNADDDDDDDDLSDYVYSKFATMIPLVDQPQPKEGEEQDPGKKEMLEEFGHWHFWDGDEEIRPSLFGPDEDKKWAQFVSSYPNGDIPGDAFPMDSWQADAVFVNHYLNDGDKLVTRVMEAIYTEYGHGRQDFDPNIDEATQLANRMPIFHWDKVDDLAHATAPPEEYLNKRGMRASGGWTTEQSFDGLVRRMLHAMMISDTFTIVLGGHSAAAGQGNHFRQSYMMQAHKVLAPVFARMGVKLITRNMAQGGLGTIQSSLGFADIYGHDIDLIIWDSGMTENSYPQHIDLFFRQALLGGNRVPVIWAMQQFELLQTLFVHADADVGEVGLGTRAIPKLTHPDNQTSIPYAARYLSCDSQYADICNNEPKFCAQCWIDRSKIDSVKPTTTQLEHPKGQVKWHPGWRMHQLQGRTIAFGILQALQAAITIWSEAVMGGPPLDDDYWHVSNHYNNIRQKVQAMTDPKIGRCHGIEGTLPTRMCTIPMKARTQYTPRADYHESSLASIVQPTKDGYVPKNTIPALYEGPDAHNSCFDLPKDALDVPGIASARRQRNRRQIKEQQMNMTTTKHAVFPSSRSIGKHATIAVYTTTHVTTTSLSSTTRQLDTEIVPGHGWKIFGEPQGYCDGTYNAICGRSADNECVLYGHHDGRGAILGNEETGWLVMNLSDVEHGIIVIKLHTWHYESELSNPTLEEDGNKVSGRRQLRQKANTSSSINTTRRSLTRNYETPELPDSFAFEYAIDGDVKSLQKKEFLEQKQQLQRVVETLTLLDDKDWNTKKDVEVAIRLTGCGTECTFGVSHIYWA